jgi:hypothetical protein
MYDFEKRLRQDPKSEDEFDDLGIQEPDDDPVIVQAVSR